jgi:ribonuclease P protein component
VSNQPDPHPAKFAKSSRLLKRAEFEQVYQSGRRHFSKNLTAFFLKRDAANQKRGPRVGLTVSRALGGAVERNRIRRRMREAARLNLKALPLAVDIVINPKKSVLKTEFSTLTEEVRRAFEAVLRSSANGGLE